MNSLGVVLTAVASLTIGAAGTYATIHATATCTTPVAATHDDGLKAFLAPPDAPLGGYKRY